MNEDVKSENLRIHSRADELIACLEGEIAKRDEELAACRVAVENCEVFRARVVELEAEVRRWVIRIQQRGLEMDDLSEELKVAHTNISRLDDLVLSLQCKVIERDAELAAIKAQEPVSFQYQARTGEWDDFVSARHYADTLADGTWPIRPIYAAPVSEAKAQGVVQWPNADEIMQMAFEEGQPADDASGYYFELEEFDLFIERLMSEVASLNAAPVQQVSVPDEMRSLAQRLREYNQNPHHINPMSDAFHILVADAANALSTACVPKEIASAITWSEHLLFECGALVQTRAPSVHVYNKTFEAVQAAKAMLAASPIPSTTEGQGDE